MSDTPYPLSLNFQRNNHVQKNKTPHIQHALSVIRLSGDKTGGWRVFVRPKLLLGSFIMGLGLITPEMSAQTKKLSKQIKNQTSYKQNSKTKNLPSKTVTAKEKEDTIKYGSPDQPVVATMCYETILETEVWNTVEQMPQYPGGDSTLISFVQKNLTQLPVTQCYNGVSAKVICRFVVEKDGSVSDITVIRSLDSTCDKEAVRVLKLLPKFIPGKQNGRVVRAYYTFPVSF
jgi:protein TonB